MSFLVSQMFPGTMTLIPLHHPRECSARVVWMALY